MRTLNIAGMMIMAFSFGFIGVGFLDMFWPKSSVGELSPTAITLVFFVGCNAGILAALLFMSAVAKVK